MSEQQRIELVPLHFIVPLPYNICRIDRETDLMLREDMTRIESKGINKIDPILLRRLTPEEMEEYKKKGNPVARFQIVDGHTRWQAARELSWDNIRAIIIDATLDETREINYKKNKVRGTVDPLREAAYFTYLHDVKKLTVDQMAEKFGISHSRVEQILRRMKITEKTKQIVRGVPGYTPSPKHYEILGSIEEPEKQEQLAKLIVEEKLSRREAEVSKEALESGVPPEVTKKVVKAVDREKLKPKEIKALVETVIEKPKEIDRLIALPKDELIGELEGAKIVRTPEEVEKAVQEEALKPKKCPLELFFQEEIQKKLVVKRDDQLNCENCILHEACKETMQELERFAQFIVEAKI